MNNLYISHYIEKTKVLGPFQRSALWVHGCCFDCDGCIAREMNNAEPTVISASEAAEIFLKVPDVEGITISGGEPFLQPEALSEMIGRIRETRDYGVIVYTGFVYNELKSKDEPNVNKFLSMIDILIDGNYIKELDDGKPFRGSSNQNILLLSDRYKDTADRYYSSTKRNIEINVTEDHVYMVGVPSEYGLKTWREFKRKAEVNHD